MKEKTWNNETGPKCLSTNRENEPINIWKIMQIKPPGPKPSTSILHVGQATLNLYLHLQKGKNVCKSCTTPASPVGTSVSL